MSKRAPVGAVVNEAVQFGLHRWSAVVRAFVAPAIVSLFAYVAFVLAIFDLSSLSETGSAGTPLRFPVGVAVLSFLALLAFLGVVVSGAYASIYRLAALGEERRGWFQIRLDGPAIRVFLSGFVKFAISLVISAILYAVGVVIDPNGMGEALDFWRESVRAVGAMLGGADPDTVSLQIPDEPVYSPGLHALNALSSLLSIYMFVKLTPFSPGSAVENRLIPFKSFRMTFGHAWSIFWAYALLFVFFIIVFVVGGFAFVVVMGVGGALAAEGAILALVGGALIFAACLAGLFFAIFTAGAYAALSAIIYRRIETGG
ncbi:MAG: hypothetical protein ACFB00_08840 [Parvularculaceae bacterium]